MRSLWVTLVAVSGFVLAGGMVQAQDVLPTKNYDAVNEVNARLSRESRSIPADELPKTKQLFLTFAKYYADLIASPAFYKGSQDPKFGGPAPRIPTMDRGQPNSFLGDIDKVILEPSPASKINEDKVDYIREMGIAFDAVLKPLIESHAERIVRINATRLLAEVCRSGATAHWPTVTALLSNPNTPGEIKLYALQAAGNLLSAYNIKDYKWRTHNNGPKEVGALVQAIMNCVVNPSHLLPGYKAGESPRDQVDVVLYLRKFAVKALAQVRFVKLPGADGKTPIYPAYTLVQICTSDPAISPSPSPGECAEAVLGLCNMSASQYGNIVKEYNTDGAVEAIAAALVTFASPRSEATDRSLPWRNYSARIAEAFKNWRPLFDPLFDATQPADFAVGSIPASVNNLVARVQTNILTPIDKLDINGKQDATAVVNIEGMKDFLRQLQENPNRKTLLFANNPDTVINIPGKK